MNVGAVLDVSGLVVRYGPIEAVHGIDLRVDPGEIVTIVGSNGAGKTSTLLAISGVHRATSGMIRLHGEEIQRLPGHDVAARGVAHVPEGRRVFPDMTVWENLAMGTYAQRRLPSDEDTQRVYELFPVLRERATQLAGTLSGGEQQMLAIGRALVARPQLLLLDEPSMGLAPKMVRLIFDLLVTINKDGATMLLVEQNARMALQIASRAYVLETGVISLSGRASNLANDDAVRAAYLGGVTARARDVDTSAVPSEDGDSAGEPVERWR